MTDQLASPTDRPDTGRLARQVPARSPWWRFTLRELLLAMTALAAVMGLVLKSWPSIPSVFAQQFNARQEFEETCAALDANFNFRGNDYRDSGNRGTLHKRWEMSGRLTGRPRKALMGGFQGRIVELLKKQGCSGINGYFDESRLYLTYRCGSRRGEFIAEFIELNDRQFKTHAFLIEFTDR